MTSPNIVGLRNVTITPSMISANVVHTFEYEYTPITNQTVFIDTLMFDKIVDFVDTAAVNFVGVVSIANTLQYNLDNPCPIENATVCLMNALGSGETISCTTTDRDGQIRLFAVPQLVSMNNVKTFSRSRQGNDVSPEYLTPSSFFFLSVL